MGSAREWGVDDDADAEPKLSVDDAPDGVVREVVEERGRSGCGKVLEGYGGVADVVFIDERDSKRRSYGVCQSAFA